MPERLSETCGPRAPLAGLEERPCRGWEWGVRGVVAKRPSEHRSRDCWSWDVVENGGDTSTFLEESRTPMWGYLLLLVWFLTWACFVKEQGGLYH